MKKIPKTVIQVSVILAISLFLFNCSNEPNDYNIMMDKLDSQSNKLKTVPLENSLDFLKKVNNDRLISKGLIIDDIGLRIDAESLEQVNITNTAAELNIANATTKFEGVETDFLQIEINGELQTILLHHVPAENISIDDSRMSIDYEKFTGDIYSTDLDGNVLSGFRMDKGAIFGVYNPSPYATDPPIKLNEVIIRNNFIKTVPNSNNYTMMNYQFVRSQNNGSSMGVAYAYYFKSLQIKKFNDGINDALLKPCLQTILKNLKKSGSSPGNMIQNFSNNWNSTNYNWIVQSGTLKGSIAETSPLYNAATGVTTIFDSQSWTAATDLSWARTILHESIHAYLVTYFKVDKPGWIATYPEMVTDWGVKQNWNAVHHEEIARGLVTLIGNSLEVYGISQGYNLRA